MSVGGCWEMSSLSSRAIFGVIKLRFAEHVHCAEQWHKHESSSRRCFNTD